MKISLLQVRVQGKDPAFPLFSLPSHMAKNPPPKTTHISQAIEEMLKTQHLKPRFDEANVIASWERLVGAAVAKRTRKVFIRNKVLFVELVSPSMKQDLSYHKSKILEIMAKEFGEGVVNEIVLM